MLEPVLTGRVVGVDLGRADDWTVAAVLDVLGDPRTPEQPRHTPRYTLVHLVRMRHQPWPVIAERLGEMARWPALDRARWAVDATGVGAPVVDLLRPHIPRLTAVTITSGMEATQPAASAANVPKVALISNLEVLVQTRRLTVDSAVRDADVLRQELAAYTYEISASGRMTSGAAGSAHDDIVLALAIGLWIASHTGQGAAFMEAWERLHVAGQALPRHNPEGPRR
jgi:hypothetical protein